MRRLLAAAALAALPTAGLAHQAGLSHGSYALRGDRLEVTLRLAADELAATWPALAAPPERLRAGIPGELVRVVIDTVSAAQRSGPCEATSGTGHPDAPDGARFTTVLRCPRDGEAVRVQLGLVAQLPPGHVHLARTGAEGAVHEQVVDARSDGFSLAADVAWGSRAGRFVSLGIEHIFTGWDHLAFLIGLLLAGGGLPSAVRVVSGFTAGHATTLALATLGAWSPPPSVVEPLIAASVVAVALENLSDLRRRTARRRRWPVALAFGLVHGFGFAGALSDLELPRAALAAALVSFNLGVELGQAAILALVFPLLALLRRSPLLERRVLPAGSTVVAAAGLVWLVERLGG
jgi:hypothetical protein